MEVLLAGFFYSYLVGGKPLPSFTTVSRLLKPVSRVKESLVTTPWLRETNNFVYERRLFARPCALRHIFERDNRFHIFAMRRCP